MKRLFLVVFMTGLLIGCSEDDSQEFIQEEITEVVTAIRISEVNPSTDEVVLSNFGEDAQDVGNFWLCLGPGAYAQISQLTSESTLLDPDGSIRLSFDLDANADGLSLFTTNTFNSSDPNVLIDFLQWGAGDQPRVSQAVAAGRWDSASNFIIGAAPYTLNGDAEDFGLNFWEAAEPSTTVRILRVNAAEDQVWLSNFGNTSVDVGSYWLCLGPGTYAQVANTTTASTVLAPGENVMLSYDVNESVDGLSIFSQNVFGSSDPDVLLDYVQWGGGNQARVGQAVTAGRWDNANNFVGSGPVYNFDGEESSVGSSFWNQ